MTAESTFKHGVWKRCLVCLVIAASVAGVISRLGGVSVSIASDGEKNGDGGCGHVVHQRRQQQQEQQQRKQVDGNLIPGFSSRIPSTTAGQILYDDHGGANNNEAFEVDALDHNEEEGAGTIDETGEEEGSQQDGQGQDDEKDEGEDRDAGVGENIDEKENRYLVFHFGPPKTASSTIQSVCGRLKHTHLNDDGYHYIGNHGMNNENHGSQLLAQALRDTKCMEEVRRFMTRQRRRKSRRTTASGAMEQEEEVEDENNAKDEGHDMPKCWQDGMVAGLREMSQRVGYKKNILFSDESINIPTWATNRDWWDALNVAAFEVANMTLVVVGVYRRLYQWLPSTHNQHFKHVIDTPWPATVATTSGDAGGGHEVVPVVPVLWKSEYVDPTTRGKKLWFRWIPTYLDEMPDTVETRILNLHQHDHDKNESVAERFFCDIVPNAKASCDAMSKEEGKRDNKKARSRSVSEVIKNPSSMGILFYDMLSVAAAKAGLIDTALYSRSEVREAVRDHQLLVLKRSGDDFPTYCADDENLEIMLNASLWWERKIISVSQNNDDVVDDHVSEFWKYVDDKHYCSIDNWKTLELDEWKTFFERFR